MTASPDVLRCIALVRIVDDDEDVRRSLSIMLRCRGWSVRAYETAESFLSEDDPSRPGCLILDVRMPGMGGLELQDRLNALGSTLPVVFLTGHGDIAMAVGAMQKGAAHFLEKSSGAEEIARAVEHFVRRSVEVRNEAIALERSEIETLLARLTERERQILRLASDLPSRLIAERLGISERTVENHRISICRKTGAASVQALLGRLERLEELERREAESQT